MQLDTRNIISRLGELLNCQRRYVPLERRRKGVEGKLQSRELMIQGLLGCVIADYWLHECQREHIMFQYGIDPKNEGVTVVPNPPGKYFPPPTEKIPIEEGNITKQIPRNPWP